MEVAKEELAKQRRLADKFHQRMEDEFALDELEMLRAITNPYELNEKLDAWLGDGRCLKAVRDKEIENFACTMLRDSIKESYPMRATSLRLAASTSIAYSTTR